MRERRHRKRTYLRDDVPFPDPRSSASRGGGSVAVDYVGGPYLFTGLSLRQEELLRERYAGRCRPPGGRIPNDAVLTEVFRIDGEAFRDLDMTGGWDYVSLDYEYREETVRMAGLQFAGSLSFEPSMKAALWTPLDDHEWFPGIVFENFFRILVAYRVLVLGGVLLHSAGLVDESGRARLFLGPSGAGKSTITELGYRGGYKVLSDDLNSILPAGGVLTVERVPFTGSFPHEVYEKSGFPLAAIYRLEKGDEDRLEPMSRAETLSLLLACSPFVNEDPFRFGRLGDVLEAIVNGIGAGRLVFSLSGGCWKVL